MKLTLPDRILKRELGDTTRYSGIKGLYGDRAWVDDLDIVNELGGHTGCVNALSWSRSGRLLASGSDDTHLNIYSYQSDSSIAPFSLATTVSTGHTANIFSIKFMPHSDDRTLVTCAGDGEVRVFDIEYAGRSADASEHSTFASSTRSRRFNNFFDGVRYLNDGNTNSRVYRSHADRVKRIVTESSPYLFLSCSEDGEVRQWDLRQPSSAYPSPRGGLADRMGMRDRESSNVPPPLISYKKYHLDLNSISCSASQPQYIALGGAHLHCFLHDRRMLGRDLAAEEGKVDSPTPSAGSHEDELMGQATRCVRRFAPNGQSRMKRTDNGHITACKISDANPNEMIVSWSGEHIYSFDLARSPDARDAEKNVEETLRKEPGKGKIKKSKDRKRKREKAASSTSLPSTGRTSSRPRRENEREGGEISLRVRYGNGQSEEIPIDSISRPAPESSEVLDRTMDSMLNETQKLSIRVAKGLVKLRKMLFSLEASSRQSDHLHTPSDPTPHMASFTSVLGYAATYLPQMDDVIRNWRYPLNPTEDDVIFHQTLRRNRESARRFVQASGTLSRVLGGKLRTAGSGESPQLKYFRQIVPAPIEGGTIVSTSKFGYDFLKSILLWLEGGPPALLQGFKRTPEQRNDNGRFPIPEHAGLEAIDDVLIPYLLEVAGNKPVINIDSSRFERDDSRIVFESQSSAVMSFANAVKIPLEELSRAILPAPDENGNIQSAPGRHIQAMDRATAMRFWGLKVGRGLLMDVGEGVNFEFVNRAFGGISTPLDEDGEGNESERNQEDIDPNEEDEVVDNVRLVRNQPMSHNESIRDDVDMEPSLSDTTLRDASSVHTRLEGQGGIEVQINAAPSDTDTVTADSIVGTESHDANDEQGDEDSGEGDDESDEDEASETEGRLFVRRSAFDRSRLREGVESHTPCSTHTHMYRGHCNVKTVKDVNFFGLQDEYVVSGSDSGHLFIWDKKTSQLVNILEGDGEVVNVVQGHPYEPILAVSGIDSTIKVFSPDARLQHDARAGINIANPGGSTSTSSLRFHSRRPHADPASTGLASRKRMHQHYQITSQNDVDRQGGMSEAFLTRGMLARLAATLRERQAAEGGADLEGDGQTIVLDDNCALM